jgi:hypothetical protein
MAGHSTKFKSKQEPLVEGSRFANLAEVDFPDFRKVRKPGTFREDLLDDPLDHFSKTLIFLDQLFPFRRHTSTLSSGHVAPPFSGFV